MATIHDRTSCGAASHAAALSLSCIAVQVHSNAAGIGNLAVLEGHGGGLFLEFTTVTVDTFADIAGNIAGAVCMR